MCTEDNFVAIILWKGTNWKFIFPWRETNWQILQVSQGSLHVHDLFGS